MFQGTSLTTNVTGQKLSVCLSVNQGCTNHAQILMNSNYKPKTRSVWPQSKGAGPIADGRMDKRTEDRKTQCSRRLCVAEA